MVKIASCFNADAKNALWQWGVKVHAKGDKAAAEFGIQYIDLKTSIKEMCDMFIEMKFIEDKRNS